MGWCKNTPMDRRPDEPTELLKEQCEYCKQDNPSVLWHMFGWAFAIENGMIVLVNRKKTKLLCHAYYCLKCGRELERKPHN